MKTRYFNKMAKLLLLLLAMLIAPITGIAEPDDITVDVVIPEGRFVMFYLKNFEDRDFFCSYIRVQATVKDRHGHVVARRSIIARNIALPASSLTKPVEAGKESIKELENQFDEPRIVGVSDPKYRCEPKKVVDVTADQKVFRNVLTDGSLGPEMVWIPAGRFRMGDIQRGGSSNEKPVHSVSVDRFALGKYELTKAEFRRFVNATGYQTDAEKKGSCNWTKGQNWRNPGSSQTDNDPVVCVSWNDATAYTKWLSEQTGHQYVLPTEAQWEYAARAGTTTKYWWGNDIGTNRANCGSSSCGDSFQYTAPVGSFAPNPFGLYDTAGNVWEWTCSEYTDKYTGKEQQCVESAGRFVVRSGSWDNGARWARSAYRTGGEPTVRIGYFGVRPARIR